MEGGREAVGKCERGGRVDDVVRKLQCDIGFYGAHRGRARREFQLVAIVLTRNSTNCWLRPKARLAAFFWTSRRPDGQREPSIPTPFQMEIHLPGALTRRGADVDHSLNLRRDDASITI
jgi:hypothetical protein